MNLIESWIQQFVENCSNQTIMYRERMSEFFKKNPVNITEYEPYD